VDGEFVELFERFVSLRYPIAGCIGGKDMVIVANQWGAQLQCGWFPLQNFLVLDLGLDTILRNLLVLNLGLEVDLRNLLVMDLGLNIDLRTFLVLNAIYSHSDHKMDITIKFTSKIHSRTYITLMCLPLLPYTVTLITNGHHHQIHIKNLLQNIYNTYVFATIAIYGYSDHKMDITFEFTLKNRSWRYIDCTF